MDEVTKSKVFYCNKYFQNFGAVKTFTPSATVPQVQESSEMQTNAINALNQLHR